MDEVLLNIIDNLAPWWDLGYVLGILMGLFFVVKSIVIAGVSGHRRIGAEQYVVMFIAGILLLNLSTTMNEISETFFMEGSLTGLDDIDSHTNFSTDSFGLYLKVSYMLVVLVGLYGVVMGGILLAASGKDGQKAGPALAHLIGGVLAINIDKIIILFSKLTSSETQQLVNNIFG
jgi:hypothetical protein